MFLYFLDLVHFIGFLDFLNLIPLIWTFLDFLDLLKDSFDRVQVDSNAFLHCSVINMDEDTQVRFTKTLNMIKIQKIKKVTIMI